MHTDTDNDIATLIAQRQKLQHEFLTTRDDGGAKIINQQITDINLQIMQLQGKRANDWGGEVRAEGLAKGSLVICKTCGKTFLVAAGHDCQGLMPSADAQRFAADVEGIEEKIVWTTKDGKRWDRLEDAIAHQRSEQIITAIYNGHGPKDGVSDAVCDHAKFIGANAAELFAILEPFFRKGE